MHKLLRLYLSGLLYVWGSYGLLVSGVSNPFYTYMLSVQTNDFFKVQVTRTISPPPQLSVLLSSAPIALFTI